MNDDEPKVPKSADRPADQEWAELAATLAADKGAAGAPAGSAGPPPGVQRAVIASSLALLLALTAVMVAGMLWWQYRQFYVSLDETDNAAALSLDRVRAAQRALQDELDDVTSDVESLRQVDTGLAERLDTLPSRFVTIEERLDAVQGGSFDARGTLLRAEAEYYLSLANTELALAGNFERATAALELADSRLAEIGNPELGPVRSAIAGELLTLRSVRLADIEGIVFGLGRLESRIDDLPLRADLPATLESDNAESLAAEPGLERLWIAIKRTFLDLVRVERRDEPVPQVLSNAARALTKSQVQIELTLARVAALRGDAQAFASGLETARIILEREFDADAGEVVGALALLRELRGFDVAPARPDISGSLNLLRQLRDEGP
jgi:uroporphyrin-3 C-methyltransferase